jgi:aconitate hydratase
MGNNLARQLIASHLVEGQMRPGEEIALKIDQFLLHDGTGPLCALQLEAMGVEQISAETAVAYCDHLLVEADSKNADDHILLQSAARRFGMWFSRPGNGTSHPQQRFGIPGKTLLGADSHTPGAGGIGMLAIGAGGLEVSMALTGQPFRLRMPEIWGIWLTGRLPDWVSAKDVILEILRRYDVVGVMDDGSQQDFSKNDVMLLPPGHDAWSVGNEPCVFVEFSRGNDYYTDEHGH